MNNYIELAHATSAPVAPCRERLATQPALMALLYYKLLEFIKLADDFDTIKRAIFYGKESVTGNMTMPQGEKDCAAAVLADDAVLELLHAGIGMATESGEFLSAVFGHLFQDGRLDKVNLGEEIGDSLWYLAKAAKFTGTTLELEMVRNIAKLAARFPNKFTDADALQRDLERERKVLEGTEPNGQGTLPLT